MNIPTKIREADLANDPAGQTSGAGARALMEAIMAEERAPRAEERAPRRPRARRRLVLGVATVGLAAAVAIAVGLPVNSPATTYANAAISITKANDNYSIAITEPVKEPRLLEEAFRAVGVQATAKMVPTMPDLVGKLYGPYFDTRDWTGNITTEPVEPCASAAFCAKFTMSGGSPDRLVFGVGRPAAPGEPYADLPPMSVGRYLSALDGYHPDGYDPHGKTVADVRDELKRRGLKAVYQLWWSQPDGGFYDGPVPSDRIKDGWIVQESRAYSSDTIEVTVIPGPEAGPAPTPSPRPHWPDIP
ncbi:hypothetical protein AB0J63_09085 [Streptosporangium canum]|uniref:hypothetical protein n=1 Tax=Streptosporangium canum TaxID=324952 RepID=UPI003449FAAC